MERKRDFYYYYFYFSGNGLALEKYEESKKPI
jgi:hypothetical protein